MNQHKKTSTKSKDEKIHPPYNNDLMKAFICYPEEEKKKAEKETLSTISGSVGETPGQCYAKCITELNKCLANPKTEHMKCYDDLNICTGKCGVD
jgi:hypothetical protein